jgi:hypothetical protein
MAALMVLTLTMQFRLDKNRDAGKRLPVPRILVLATLILVGIFGVRKAQKPVYYLVEDGDAVCVLGECRKRNYDGGLDLSKMQQRDVNLVYPGTRCVPIRAFLKQVIVSVLHAHSAFKCHRCYQQLLRSHCHVA